MKLVLVGMTLLFVCYSHQDDDDKPENLAAMKDQCAKGNGVDPSALDKFGDFAKFKDNQPFKCFLKCLLERFGAISEEGELIDEVCKKEHFGISPQNWSKLYGKCRSVKGSDPCETAFLLGLCVEKVAKDF